MLSALQSGASWFGFQHLLHSIVSLGRWNDLWQFLAFHEQLYVGSVQHFAFNQRQRNPYQSFSVVRENVLGSRITIVDYLADFLIDLDGSVFAVVAMLIDLAAQEDLFFLLAEGQWAKIAHAPLTNHLASQFSCALNVIARASAHLSHEEFFGQPPAHHDGNLRLQIVF